MKARKKYPLAEKLLYLMVEIEYARRYTNLEWFTYYKHAKANRSMASAAFLLYEQNRNTYYQLLELRDSLQKEVFHA